MDGLDNIIFRAGYPRSYYQGKPCAICVGGTTPGEKCLSDAECGEGGDCTMDPTDPCLGDLNCDMAVDGLDTLLYREDYPRTEFLGDPCPACSKNSYPCEYPE